MSENEHAVFLAERYYATGFGRRPSTIGEAITTAMQEYEQTWRPQYLLRNSLLGDPRCGSIGSRRASEPHAKVRQEKACHGRACGLDA
jgi:hypothetical protein